MPAEHESNKFIWQRDAGSQTHRIIIQVVQESRILSQDDSDGIVVMPLSGPARTISVLGKEVGGSMLN